MSRSVEEAGLAAALRGVLSEAPERSGHGPCTSCCSPRGRFARQPARVSHLMVRRRAPRSCLWWTPNRRCLVSQELGPLLPEPGVHRAPASPAPGSALLRGRLGGSTGLFSRRAGGLLLASPGPGPRRG
eukprot:XP_001705630.1 Hypothetical protein GL50803_31430 [Giardia lamblia ATCC 50803]